MFKNLGDLTRAAIYYLLAICFAVAVAASPLPEGPRVMLYMFTPMLATLLMLLVVTRDGRTRPAWRALGLGRAGLRLWPAAVLAPLLVIGIAYTVAWTSGIGRVDHSKYLATVPLDILIVVVVMTLTTSLGEEIGWRGYLLPHLASLGRGRSALLSGVLHGFWHFPLILMTSIYIADGSRWVTLPLFMVTLTSAGIAYAYVRSSTGSVWPAAIAHSVHNATTASLAGVTLATPLVAVTWLSEGGVLLPLGYTLVAGCVAYRWLRRPVRSRLLRPARQSLGQEREVAA